MKGVFFYPGWTEEFSKNYHFKTTEVTEQKMRINVDGTREIDTVHRKEHSEKVYDDDNKRSVVLKLMLLLLLVVAFIVVFYKSTDWQCLGHFSFTSHNADTDGKQVYIDY